MTRRWLVALPLLALLSGCTHAPAPAAPSAAPALSFLPASTTLTECPVYWGVRCFEPTLAADPAGRLFSTAGEAASLLVSSDGGATWVAKPTPPMPALAPAPLNVVGDNTVQVDPQGRLWFTRLVYADEGAAAGAGLPVSVGRDVGGYQVARSDDGGDSWAVDRFVGVEDPSPTPVMAPDRQWLAFGPGGVVHLAYWQFEPAPGGYLVASGTRYVASSADGGATFGSAREAPAAIGGLPSVAADGTLYLPTVMSDGERFGAGVAWTRDGGATWETELVAEAEMSGLHVLFASLGEDGVLHSVWTTKDGGVVAASGRPHAWGAPETVGGGALGPDPFVLAHDGVVDLMWFEASGDGQDAVLLREGPGGARERVVLGHWGSTDPTSDFGWLARLPDGRVAATWTDPAKGVQVALEAPAA